MPGASPITSPGWAVLSASCSALVVDTGRVAVGQFEARWGISTPASAASVVTVAALAADSLPLLSMALTR